MRSLQVEEEGMLDLNGLKHKDVRVVLWFSAPVANTLHLYDKMLKLLLISFIVHVNCKYIEIELSDIKDISEIIKCKVSSCT
jgi:hypothetical protein